MPFDLSQLQPDADKKGGVWTPLVLTLDGRQVTTEVELLIRYQRNNDALLTRQASLLAELQRTNPGRPVSAVLQLKATRRAFVGPVLKGWRNYVDEGKEVPYAQAAAEEQMVKYGELADFVAKFSDDLANFRTAEAEPAKSTESGKQTPREANA